MGYMRLMAIGVTKMKQINNKQYEEYQQFLKERSEGRILTPEGLRFICEAYDYDPEKIGMHFLELLPRIIEKDNT